MSRAYMSLSRALLPPPPAERRPWPGLICLCPPTVPVALSGPHVRTLAECQCSHVRGPAPGRAPPPARRRLRPGAASDPT
ncbi:hypothetical protein LALCDEHK_00073 [bovine alphaherpesvirus 1]|nr:hypothetical protein DJCKHMNK_00061 [Bovine alphaherpesvirus 1]AVM39222.1 hypothetical protein DJCKHMNK_00073 [Bovine alphaherpesvirus 1]AVM39285.1 hypothetical protein GOGNHFCO_00062 [Bovine alphaherpesvirus 1]AVM39298.1 hypothetical protein GOGNHFCO_00075 [Bovine alphaherpesvirus 1]AVM39361.1 hypothetical protein OCMKPLLD_00061 [Bovine alphaherpesvirus 1]